MKSEFLYIENYQALLACIVNDELTINQAIERIIELSDFSGKHFKITRRKRDWAYLVIDTYNNKEYYFINKRKMVQFFKDKNDYVEGTVRNTIYRNINIEVVIQLIE
ncbi:MAG: hypothetical protein R3Y64_10660 [Peptostreptococcaceae bacterium]